MVTPIIRKTFANVLKKQALFQYKRNRLRRFIYFFRKLNLTLHRWF